MSLSKALYLCLVLIQQVVINVALVANSLRSPMCHLESNQVYYFKLIVNVVSSHLN